MTAIMPRNSIEEQHNATGMNGLTLVQYIGAIFNSNQRSLPAMDHFEGVVKAELYRGLWIARCPEDGCQSAVAVTAHDPRMACGDCGAGWFTVEFPENKTEIEAELNKRPIPRKGLVHHNWAHGTSMETLEAETMAKANI